MMGSTPIDRRKSKLGSLAVAATSAPFQRANCAANDPTPPLAPWMRKRIPGFAFAVSMMACQAVSAGIGRAAATLKSSERGFFTKSFTGTSAYSAKLPKTSPKTSSPSRSGVFDPGPIFSMTPAKSCPSVSGTRSAPFGLYWCSRTIQSTGLTPAAWIRTSALPRVTLGVSTSSSWTRSGPPNSWMRTAFMGSPPGWDEVVREPLRCERANDLQRAGLFEEMRRAGDSLELLLSPQHRERLAVETKDHVVGSSYDQERRRAHLDEQLSGEVGPSAARNHRRDAIGLACGGHQSRRCARTRPEQADRKSSGLLVVRQPLHCSGETVREQPDVEAQVAGEPLRLFFVRRQQVHQQRGETPLLQRLGNEAIAPAEAAAAAAVSEENGAASPMGDGEISAESHSRTQDQLDLALAHVHRGPPCDALSPSTERSSSSRTSSSVVWVKSSYQSPTARNGSGVAAQITSSASSSISAHVDGAAMGTATMTRAARS